MRAKSSSLLLLLMFLAVFAITSCGDSGGQATSEKSVAKVLGEVWEGLNANNQEPYNALKEKTFELTLAVISPEIQLQSKAGNSGGKIALEAFTIIGVGLFGRATENFPHADPGRIGGRKIRYRGASSLG